MKAVITWELLNQISKGKNLYLFMELQIYGVTDHRKIIKARNRRNVMNDIKKN